MSLKQDLEWTNWLYNSDHASLSTGDVFQASCGIHVQTAMTTASLCEVIFQAYHHHVCAVVNEPSLRSIWLYFIFHGDEVSVKTAQHIFSWHTQKKFWLDLLPSYVTTAYQSHIQTLLDRAKAEAQWTHTDAWIRQGEVLWEWLSPAALTRNCQLPIRNYPEIFAFLHGCLPWGIPNLMLVKKWDSLRMPFLYD